MPVVLQKFTIPASLAFVLHKTNCWKDPNLLKGFTNIPDKSAFGKCDACW